MSLAAALTESWTRRGALACALWPFSLLFGALAGLRRVLYRVGILQVTRLPVPLIVVGNIFVGGTGKTPFTLWLIAQMRAAGYTPGVISRGYGAAGDGARAVTSTSTAQEVGDEPLLIAQRSGAPVMVGRDRPAAARALLAAHPQVDLVISDDGLQHYALGRDIEIVLSDGRGAGNGWLLPAGPLREPQTRRRDFSVVNSATAGADVYAMRLRGDHAEQLNAPGQRRSLAELAGRSILAAAGIGNPARFFTLLQDAGLRCETLALPDHYAYSENPFARSNADIILITEKDAVKCRQNAALKNDPRIWFVPVEAHIAENAQGALAQHIVEKLRGYPTA